MDRIKFWIVRGLADLCKVKDRLIAHNSCDLAKASYLLDQRWNTEYWRNSAKGD